MPHKSIIAISSNIEKKSCDLQIIANIFLSHSISLLSIFYLYVSVCGCVDVYRCVFVGNYSSLYKEKISETL